MKNQTALSRPDQAAALAVAAMAPACGRLKPTKAIFPVRARAWVLPQPTTARNVLNAEVTLNKKVIAEVDFTLLHHAQPRG